MDDIWIQSATDIIGKVKKQNTKPWISDQVVDMAVKKREAKKKGDHIEYNRLKREIHRMIRIDNNAWLEKECAQNQACINDTNSITLTDTEEVLDRWHEYGTNLLGNR